MGFVELRAINEALIATTIVSFLTVLPVPLTQVMSAMPDEGGRLNTNPGRPQMH